MITVTERDYDLKTWNTLNGGEGVGEHSEENQNNNKRRNAILFARIDWIHLDFILT